MSRSKEVQGSHAVLPHLINIERIKRVQFTLSQLHDPLDNSLDRHFKSQLDTVCLDENLFYTTDESETYYQLPLEDSSKKKGKSKKYSIKFIFLAATARPSYDHHTKSWWDGKIGIYPIVEMVPAAKTDQQVLLRLIV